ncbi:L-dopachrome tautomerase-related protein [Pedobacter sp. UBA5917]|uniref:L-dopachrome tautomerase-related protein n=1 Tax=Pedobacter sp. UBA5917 TaxID=1947061 RepID=UPI0025F83668|nr:L-dopachrome tautomerase-related protein [Pedobacter sp. UBA5917]
MSGRATWLYQQKAGYFLPSTHWEIQLVEIKNKKAIPYPSINLQKNGQKASDQTIDSPLGIIFDKKNRLWVTDMGLNLGKTRLWCFNIKTNQVIEKIEIPEAIAPAGTFAQDVAIDEKNNWAYLADINNPGIIAINLKTKEARRWSGHVSLQAENKDMVIDGKVVYFKGKPARVAIDPITISADRETIFYGAMVGTTWYKLPAKLFREGKSDQTIADAVQKAGNKPMSDGATTDEYGNHYFTNSQEHAITKVDVKGKSSNIVQDEKIKWPDNVIFGPVGWIYVTANQLNTTPAFTGTTDTGKAPYYIYRFKINKR